MKQDRGDKSPNAKTTTEREGQSRKQLYPAQYKRSRMEIIAYAFGICAFVFGTIAALFGVIHYRDTCIWTSCAAIVLAVIGGFCWLQDREWKKDAASQRLLRITPGLALSEECDKWIERGKALRERLVNPDSQKQAVEEAPSWLDDFQRFARQNFPTIAEYDRLVYFRTFEKPTNGSLNEWAQYYQRCVGWCYGQLSILKKTIKD